MRQYTSRVSPFIRVSICTLVLGLSWTGRAAAQVVFDHVTGAQSASGLLEFKVNEDVTLTINSTAKACFDYNSATVASAPSVMLASMSGGESVVLRTKHQRGVTAYKVTVTRKKDPNCATVAVDGVKLENREWIVGVVTLGWTVGLSAAFTIDELTDPQYSLEPSTSDGVAGFLVDEDMNARDDTNQSLAILLHLSNTAALEMWETDIRWAPLTFGVGFKDNTEYYVGTSFQFGDPFFLTVGRVFGKQTRLPNGLAVGDFTTDANALSTLGTRTDDAWFIGFSYQFLSTGLDNKLKGIFGGKTESPPPKQP